YVLSIYLYIYYFCKITLKIPDQYTIIRFCPNCMIGKKVRVFWPVDSSWYIGTVQQFDASTGEHLLEYEDDDTEWVQIGESNTTMNPSAPQVGALPQQQQLAGGPGRASPPNETDSSSLLENANASTNANTTTSATETETAAAIANDVTSADTTAAAIANEGTSADAPSSSYRTYGSGQHHLPPHLSHPHPHHAYSHPSGGPGGFSSHGHGPPPPSSSLGYGYPGQHSMAVPQRHGSSATGQPHHPYGGIHGHNPHRLESPSPITTASGQIGSGDNGGGNGKQRKTGPKAWTKEEDSLLLSIVQSMRVPMKWSLVAQNLPERTGKQCRERYVNHLNPRLKVADWSPTEDATIFHLYNTIGSHWAKMSKIIPGRTDNGIKNRFHNLRRQLEREDEHRLRLSAARDFPEEIRLELLREFPKELRGKAAELWDIKSGLSVLAAQSILGGGVTRTSSRFGPFREAEVGVESCVRCGFILPSVQTGSDICTKTGWCQSCARIPPHVSGNMLRECLNLRRCQKAEKRKIIESWELPGNKKAENADKSVQ
ncbi:MAG: hypothetical protein ACI8RD_011404, partial [Bacillariaceae sp.]